MAFLSYKRSNIAGITTCVTDKSFDNLSDASAFPKADVEKIVRMAGVRNRFLADETVCSSDLCREAAKDLMEQLEWDPASVDALIMVTQSPDYFLPSTSCVLQHDLGLPTECLAFDVGLGCSGYTYGLMIAASMLQGKGVERILLLHGETPSRFAHSDDRSVALLFGDAGSATAIEAPKSRTEQMWHFCLHTDGSGYDGLIMRGGGFRNRFPENPLDHYVYMDGAGIFNFTIKRVPSLVQETLAKANSNADQIDYFILHQSNQFIMRHLIKKIGVPIEKVPFTINDFGSTGGPSVPLTMTKGGMERPAEKALSLLLVAYGVGLSWGSALVDLPPDAKLNHITLKGS